MEDFEPYKMIGTPKTIGELKKLIENYPDETSFGFLNQPMQDLFERKFGDQVFVCFQGPDEFEELSIEETIERLNHDR